MRKMQISGFVIAIAFILSLSETSADHAGNMTLSSLPAAAQASISGALGRDNPVYSAKAVASGFEITNAGQKLVTRFTSEGVDVRHGQAFWGLALRGYGYGDALTTVKAVAPQSRSNRVEYRRGALTEWYVNGPAGLEQGFTLSQPPDKTNGQPLTIALAVLGNMTMTLDESHISVNLSDGEGNPVLRYAGLTANDAGGNELQAWLEVHGKRLLLRVNDAKARYPVVIDPWVQLAKLTTSDGGGALGYSVAINADTVVAGAWGAFDQQGAAYVFVKPMTGWANMTETARLMASDGVSPDRFGGSVAISGDTVVVGAPYATNGGAAYVFVKPPIGWSNMTETAKLTVPDGQYGEFGRAVGIAGSTVVIGELSGSAQGAVYVFVKPPHAWRTTSKFTAMLTASDDAPGHWFGSSVAISGHTVVAGAYGIDAAYVFVKPTEDWTNMTETAKLTGSNGSGGDGLGWSVATKGDTVVAGAPFNNQRQGAAFVFVEPPSGWASMTETALLIAEEGAPNDRFGESVTIWQNKVVVGAPNRKHRQGRAYIFAKPATGWTTTSNWNAKLTASDKSNRGYLGRSVCINNGVAVAGTPGANAAYVFGDH